ncbi:MAG TPA: diacylglycerol kinase family protein [Candidatus Dojkabacteria bacterium]|nr:diacylglycerol kinase family protein [Candidatus Dojkabacteria bacterium]
MRKKQNFLRSVVIAFKGLFHGLLKERNSRIQLLVASGVIIGSIILGISKLEMLVTVTACFFVIILEMINTSIERVLDVIYPDENPEVGLIKDIMSGVVLLGSLLAVAVGIIILYEPFIDFVARFIG